MKRLVLFLALLSAVPAYAGRSFNGTSDIIRISASGAIDLRGSTSMTMVCWFEVANVPSSEADICGIGNYHSGADYYLSYLISLSDPGHAGEVGIHIYQSTPEDHNVDIWCSTAVSTNQWYSVVMQYTGSESPGLFLLLNGVQCDATSTQGTVSNSSASVDFCVGGWASTGTTCDTPNFAGTVAEIAIWGHALSTPTGSLEGAALALGTICPVGPSARRLGISPPLGYWPLYGASGLSIEPDLSGSKQTGTLSGTSPADHPPCTP